MSFPDSVVKIKVCIFPSPSGSEYDSNHLHTNPIYATRWASPSRAGAKGHDRRAKIKALGAISIADLLQRNPVLERTVSNQGQDRSCVMPIFIWTFHA
jgi:hypothetical protein